MNKAKNKNPLGEFLCSKKCTINKNGKAANVASNNYDFYKIIVFLRQIKSKRILKLQKPKFREKYRKLARRELEILIMLLIEL